MQPLATCHERFPFILRRDFELHEDRLVVTIRRPWIRQEIPVDLSRLDANAGRLWKVKPWFPLALVPGVLLLITAPLTVSVFFRPVAWTHWGCSFLVGLLLIRGFQKVEWAQFRNIAKVVVIDIARHGPDRLKHEAFVDRVMLQITLARQNMMQAAVMRLQRPPGDDEGYRSN